MKVKVFNFTIHIYPHNITNAERVKKLYRNRREKNLCKRCSAEITEINPYSGIVYRACVTCRTDENRRKKVIRERKELDILLNRKINE